jgi:hypothetical protein
MTTVTQSLIDKIGKDIENTKDEDGYGVVDIWMLMQCLALDVIGETAFGQTFKMIENNNHFIPGVIKHEMKSTAVNGMFPILSKIFVKSATQTDPRLYNVGFFLLVIKYCNAS